MAVPRQRILLPPGCWRRALAGGLRGNLWEGDDIARLERDFASLIGAEEAASFQPALLDVGYGQREIVYVVEDLGNSDLIVLCPHAPSGFAGPLKISHADHITPLEASLGEVSLVFNHMGLGAGRLLKTKGSEPFPGGEKKEVEDGQA